MTTFRRSSPGLPSRREMLSGFAVLLVLACVAVSRSGRPLRTQAAVMDTVSVAEGTPAGADEAFGDPGITLAWGDAAAAAPRPVIRTLRDRGMAPFTVHVHALDSDLRAGDVLSGRFEWDFGDPARPYDHLEGWNAAHVYDRPGLYTITLTLTNERGRRSSATLEVSVLPSERDVLYVATTGRDTNDGRSIDRPLATPARALGMMRDGTAVLLRRGDVFEIDRTLPDIAHHDCVLGAYGTGERPVLRWVGRPGERLILGTHPERAKSVVIQGIRFDSIHAAFPDRNIVDALRLGGQDLTVRDCAFDHLTTALNTNRRPIGVLSQDNSAGRLRAYYLWGEGWNHTHLGNVVADSTHEHNIRFGGIHRVLLAHNHLTNTKQSPSKRCLWSMAGEYGYFAHNVLNTGRSAIGPDHAGGSPRARFRWAVMESNVINKTTPEIAALEVEAGSEHVMLRNNIIRTEGNTAIAVKGYRAEFDRTLRDVRILNNTVIQSGRGGRFLSVERGAIDLQLANNLFIAPNLVTGDHRRAIVYVEDVDLSCFTMIRDNVWPVPDGFDSVDDGYHYVFPSWPSAEGYRSPAAWAAFDQTTGDRYEHVVLDETYRPAAGSAADGHARRQPGVYMDVHGDARPDGRWTAGAVNLTR